LLTNTAALGIATVTLRYTPAGSNRGNTTQQVIKIAISAWPIVFAAILAQSLKAYATYRVEKKAGIQLMVSPVFPMDAVVANEC
jgi:hypothetical protein